MKKSLIPVASHFLSVRMFLFLFSFVMSIATQANPILDNITEKKGLPSGVSNSGMLVVEGDNMILSAKSASGILDRTINMHGVIEGKSVGMGVRISLC